MGKAIMSVIKQDVMTSAGPTQLCAGQDAGCEAAVHALHALFSQEDTEAVILVDASNAFNNLNRQVALRNIEFQCPIISKLLINCYRGNAPLFVGGTSLLSQEGVTQGDPLSMAMFALATVPLIHSIATESATQIWFADDAGAGGPLAAVRKWWDALNLAGPRFGYFPNEVKTTVLVKPEHRQKAEKVLHDTNLQISSEGKRYLGGCIGNDEFSEQFVKSTISTWAGEVERLAKLAKSQPHAAFAALTHGLTSRWTYLTRVTSFNEDLLKPLENVIRHDLIPALTGQPQPSDSVRQLLALPAKHGGLGIVDPTRLQARNFSSSEKICEPLVKAILHQRGNVLSVQNEQRRIKAEISKKSNAEMQASSTILSASLSEPLRRCVSAAQEKGASAWLTALPLHRHGFALHKGAFRDAVALRYGWPLAQTPSLCVCKQVFSADHALICKYGGYPTLRHNEVRDVTAKLLSEVCVNVSREPRLQPLTGERLHKSANTDDEARVDIKAQGFWGNDGQDAFFDVRVFHPNASTYQNTKLPSLYRLHEAKKKSEYGRRIREVEHGCFTPLVFTTGGSMAPEATVFFRRLASLLAEKRNEPYSVVMHWVRCLLSFSLLRSSLLCIRGSRSTRSFCPTMDNASLVVAESRLRH